MASLFFERISSSSSYYSSSTRGRKYDAFLSFRGEESRHGFTDHLYEELRRKRIHVFRDDEKLQRGEVVALEIMKAIEESQYAIVVLSEKFADSKWCLDELAKIVECRKKRGLSIFPVFDHVDPSDVHNQKGPFETVFAKHETDDSVTIEKKQKWMDALRDVSNISGWCLHDR